MVGQHHKRMEGQQANDNMVAKRIRVHFDEDVKMWFSLPNKDEDQRQEKKMGLMNERLKFSKFKKELYHCSFKNLVGYSLAKFDKWSPINY